MAAPIGNKYALGNSGGRPAYYDTPEQLAEQVNEFFKTCDDNKTKATVTGLALFLGFSSRSSLDAYEEKGEEFKYIIKRSKLAVENSYELSGQTIDIFALKNMGWKDKTEVESNNTHNINWVEQWPDEANNQTGESPTVS
jgi:hypothetical protein